MKALKEHHGVTKKKRTLDEDDCGGGEREKSGRGTVGQRRIEKYIGRDIRKTKQKQQTEGASGRARHSGGR